MAKPMITLDSPAQEFDLTVDLAAQRGYNIVAIHVNQPGVGGAAISLESGESECVATAKSALAKGVSIAAVVLSGATALEWLTLPRIEPGGLVHHSGASSGLLSTALERAQWLGARQLVLPAVVPIGVGTSPLPGDDAIRAALEALAAARFEAQRRAIEIVVMVSPHGVCHSPSESRWFFDQVNSPWVGAGIEADEATVAPASERLGALAHRARSVIWRGVTIGEAFAPLLKAMAVARFDGTLLVRSPAQPPHRAEWNTLFAQVI